MIKKIRTPTSGDKDLICPFENIVKALRRIQCPQYEGKTLLYPEVRATNFGFALKEWITVNQNKSKQLFFSICSWKSLRQFKTLFKLNAFILFAFAFLQSDHFYFSFGPLLFFNRTT
jgi:hypothetical protein